MNNEKIWYSQHNHGNGDQLSFETFSSQFYHKEKKKESSEPIHFFLTSVWDKKKRNRNYFLG